MRGIPSTGVIICARLFRRVVLVTTGSGIGPCLSLLTTLRKHDGSRPTRVKLIWSTPAPLATFGQKLVDEVRQASPGAVVWDTRVRGRPDMLGLVWETYREFEAEAVVVLSNAKVTADVVYGMESRGVPAYGPIFDS